MILGKVYSKLKILNLIVSFGNNFLTHSHRIGLAITTTSNPASTRICKYSLSLSKFSLRN